MISRIGHSRGRPVLAGAGMNEADDLPLRHPSGRFHNADDRGYAAHRVAGVHMRISKQASTTVWNHI